MNEKIWFLLALIWGIFVGMLPIPCIMKIIHPIFFIIGFIAGELYEKKRNA